MKLKRIVSVLLAALLVLPGAAVSQAQEQPPLIILADNDLWTVDGTSLTNVTHDGHIQGAALSPDGTRIAYRNWSPISVEAVERVGAPGGGSPPSDITVLNLTTLAITPIAIQPADASFLVDGVPDNAILRSAPTWSPDGTRLAWGELHYPSFAPETNRLVIYDFNRGDTEVLVTNLPDQYEAGPSPGEATWGSSGLAAIGIEYDFSINDWFTSIQVYSDQDGSLLSSTRLPESDVQRFSRYLWVHSSELDEIAVQYTPAGNWDLINPLTGNLHPALAVPELYNPLAPESAAVTFAYHADAEWPDFYSWTLTYPNGQQIEGQNRVSGTSSIALSPDGQAVAQFTSDGLLTFLWPDGHVTEGPTLEGRFAHLYHLYWGPTAWRIDQPVSCGNALPPRLVVGHIGIVSHDTTPNNLRSQPAVGEVIGQIQPGEDFTVMAGPECVDGMYWWQVDYNGTVGWTAEGDSREYWLTPTIG